MFRKTLFASLILILLLAACAGPTTEAPASELTVPPASPTPSTAVEVPAETPTTPPTLPPAPTLALPTAVPTATPAAPTATPEPATVQIVRVLEDDVLNVRAEPGVDGDIVGELLPGTAGLEISAPGNMVEGSLWVPISAPGVDGWVNSYFLTTEVTGETFCDAAEPRELVDALIAAVEAGDEEAFGALVHPERGLHIHTAWYNDSVYYAGDARFTIFSSDEVFDWGLDASGDIQGTFADVVEGKMLRDIPFASTITCNVLEHGGTAGLVVIPDYYEGINYYSLYRPADPDSPSFPFDWGTWVVGVERWDGEYTVSYLIHYLWEP